MDVEPVLKILLAEDEPAMAQNIKRLVERRFDALVDVAADVAAARAALSAKGYDVILLDYQLPDGDGLTLLGEVASEEEHPPVIMVTGHGDENTAVKAFQNGAAGYVVKDQRLASMLPDAIEKALAGLALKRAQERARSSEEQLTLVADSVPMLIARVSGDLTYLYVNKPYAEWFSRPLEYFPGKSVSDVLGEKNFERIKPRIDEVLSGKTVEYEYELVEGGEKRILCITLVPRIAKDGTVTDYFSFTEDSTESARALEDREYQAMLLENINDAVVATDNDLVITAWNRGAELLYGWAADEVIGRIAAEVLGTEYQSGSREDAKRTVEERGFFGQDVRQRRKDGSVVDVESQVVAFKDAGGNVRGYLAVNRNVTEQRREKEKLSQVLGGLPVAVMMLDSEGRIDYANARMERLLGGRIPVGMTLDEVPGLYSVFLAGTGERFPRERAPIRRALAGEATTVANAELEVEGKRIALEISGSPIFGPDGSVRHAVAVAIDTSARKRMEDELKRDHDMLEVLTRELEGYAHTVAHDLRGPLSAVNLASALLRDTLVDVKTESVRRDIEEAIGSIEKNLSRSYELINGLLSLAEAGQQPTAVEDVDIGAIVREVLEERSAEVSAKGVKVYAPADLGTVRASRIHMYQLFANLVSNALRHNDSSAPEIRIEYIGRAGDGTHTYRVCDNGSGIPDSELEKIFIPFYRHSESGDTGIGLATVKKIVGVYGGTVRAYNDSGACFEMTLRDYE